MVAKTIKIEIPEEFAQLCEYDMVSPSKVLCGFMADACGWHGEWIRTNLPHLAERWVVNRAPSKEGTNG